MLFGGSTNTPGFFFVLYTSGTTAKQKTRWNFPSWNLNWMIGCYTLVKFNSKFAPEKRVNPKRNFVVQPSIFRCNSLGVREGYHFFPDPEVARKTRWWVLGSFSELDVFLNEIWNPDTRWAPTYEWRYNPCKWHYRWLPGVTTPISGVITLLITGEGHLSIRPAILC